MYSNELICNILNFLNQNINRNVSINELGNRFHYDKIYIMKLFKKIIGVCPKSYKKFMISKFSINDDDINLICLNLSNLVIFIEQIKNYKNRLDLEECIK